MMITKFCLGALLISAAVWAQSTRPAEESYLSWGAEKAKLTGKAMISKGRVGGFWDLRVKHTERSYNYKLRATWLIPEVIRAAARLEQIKLRLSPQQAKTLVEEAEAAGDTVVLVEIDPREGSGVIPLEWQAWLRPKGATNANQSVLGTNIPKLRIVKALAGTMQRDYDYDVFWVIFPLTTEDQKPLFSDSDTHAELAVRIYEKEGRAEWLIPSSIRTRTEELLETRTLEEQNTE